MRLVHVVKRTIGIYAMQPNRKISRVSVVLLLWHCSLNSSNRSFLSGHIMHGLARTTGTTGEASGAIRLPLAHQGSRGEPKQIRTLRGHYKRLLVKRAPSQFSVEIYNSRTPSLFNFTFIIICVFFFFVLSAASVSPACFQLRTGGFRHEVYLISCFTSKNPLRFFWKESPCRVSFWIPPTWYGK